MGEGDAGEAAREGRAGGGERVSVRPGQQIRRLLEHAVVGQDPGDPGDADVEARGRLLGGGERVAAAKARKAKGESITAIAKALGVSRATLHRHLG
ncbi:helix-turn-helix domain-containing protein [Streptomyces sp. NPDC005648]|uniref:helix-turn-helix domain-containing protein n=1 Tax=Streptomyces sp. NPDC005648 TaxID=3157044 RepID=UPI0033BE33EF